MLIISGKTCSGKTRIGEELEKYGYKKCITYTTRSMREQEQDDVDYHFITEEKFCELNKQNFFIETQVYNTVYGAVYYGTPFQVIEPSEDKKYIILTPSGAKAVKDKCKSSVKILYLYANSETIKKRSVKRKDFTEEFKRRLQKDDEDFRGFELEAGRIIYNNEHDLLEDVVSKILLFDGYYDANRKRKLN